MSEKHSPLPFRNNPKNGRVLFDADGNKVLTCQAKGPTAWADAEMIVLAANAFPALVEALEDLISFVEPALESGVRIPGLATVNKAKAALKLAKGEPQ